MNTTQNGGLPPLVGFGYPTNHLTSEGTHMTFEQSIGLLIVTGICVTFFWIVKAQRGLLGTTTQYGSLAFVLVFGVLMTVNASYSSGVFAQWRADFAEAQKSGVILSAVHTDPVPGWVFALLYLVAGAYFALALVDIALVSHARGKAE